MTEPGINRTLQAVILAPEFDDIHDTASYTDWTWEAIRMWFEALDYLIDHTTREYERRQGIITMEGSDGDHEENSTTEASASLDGHTMLWRVCTKPEADFCDHQSWMLNFNCMSRYPGDFKGHRTYITPQWETANCLPPT